MQYKGISWVEGKILSDLHFADDKVILRDSWDGMQIITSTLENEVEQVGLVINVAKGKNHDNGQ